MEIFSLFWYYIENVNSNISMTKRYANILDESILNDMQKMGSNSTSSII